MMRIIFICLAIALVSSCSLNKETNRKLTSVDELHHRIPEELNMRLVSGSIQHEDSQYAESANWVSTDRKLEMFTRYIYLSDNYVYNGQKTKMSDLVNYLFEDRINTKGEESTVERPEGEYSHIDFKLNDAECLLFRHYIRLGTDPDTIDGVPVVVYLGDAQILGYLCAYRDAKMPIEDPIAFMQKISFDRIIRF